MEREKADRDEFVLALQIHLKAAIEQKIPLEYGIHCWGSRVTTGVEHRLRVATASFRRQDFS